MLMHCELSENADYLPVTELSNQSRLDEIDHPALHQLTPVP